MRATTILFVAAIATTIAACSPSNPTPNSALGGEKKGAPTPDASAGAGSQWTRYENDRFGYAIAVPPDFVADEAPDNNDGRVFRDGDTSLTVFGRHNVLDSTFADQIAQMREGLSDVRVKSESAASWRATARTSDGWMVHMLVVRPDPGDLVVSRFSYPRSDQREFEEEAGSALDSLRLIGKMGRLSFRYPPEVLPAVDATVKLPPDYDQSLPATKLLPLDRAARLGTPGCSYGLSGQSEICAADKEAGLAFAVDDVPVATLRKRYAVDRVEASTLAGRKGFAIAQGAEGEGARFAFIPAGDRTLVVERLWRGSEGSKAYRNVLRSLSLSAS